MNRSAEPNGEHPPSASRARPFPADWTVERGRAEYLRENAFTLEAYDAHRTPASFLGISFGVPNTPRHRWGIMLHDLHHVATGYGTDLPGEAEVSAWELRRGLRPLGPYVGTIVMLGVLAGLFVAPRRTWRAWRVSNGGGSLLHDGHSYQQLLRLTIAELRTLLRLPRGGLSTKPRGLHSLAPDRARP